MIMDTKPVLLLDPLLAIAITGIKPKPLISLQTLPPKGSGFISSKFPDAITSVDGVPTQATVRIIYRSQKRDLADGMVVKQVVSNPDGTWRVDGLNPNLLYDVVGRIDDANDIIVSQITPVVE